MKILCSTKIDGFEKGKIYDVREGSKRIKLLIRLGYIVPYIETTEKVLKTKRRKIKNVSATDNIRN